MKEITGCLGLGLGVDMVEWHLEILKDDGYIHYLDCSDGFMGIFIY